MFSAGINICFPSMRKLICRKLLCGFMEKLKHLLEHWIEHSKEHTKKYEEWAEKIRDERPDVADLLMRAVEKFIEGEKLLEEAMNKL